ncbi:DedA family protein [Candidatus Azambacteria bacterium]|nr:DedA family protein [Candidatus Azambacteria bacterium]
MATAEISILEIIYSFILNHRILSYWVIFSVSLLEAVVFIGILIPGTTLLMIVGFLIYQNYIDPFDSAFLALLGAVLGDLVSFLLGIYAIKKYELKKLANIDKVLDKKNYLGYGEKFFKKHGGKSVFFGRFVGMVRPFIPFIAGTSGMPFVKFMYFNIAGAILWVLVYISVGYLFGGSVDVIVSKAKKVEHTLLVIVTLLILILYIKNIYDKKFKQKIIERSEKILDKIEHQ